MYKICVLTAARSEYGLMRWLMQDIKNCSELRLQLVVTGSHLSSRFGETWREIEAHGFNIDAKIEMLGDDHSTAGIASSMGRCAQELSSVFSELKPDLLVVLGDRYELLPVCSVATVMEIPIAHISGGDVTEGALDDAVRHAVTKMSSLHLVSSQIAFKRVLQMGEEPWRVTLAGGPGLDNLRRLPSLPREHLADNLGLDAKQNWGLLTWHPETKISLAENLEALENILAATLNVPSLQTLATFANADPGGDVINKRLQEAASASNGKLVICPSLGQERYVNMLRHAKFMIGNSSSAIFETPTIALPAINIGNRQKGRLITPNIITCGYSLEQIRQAIALIDTQEFKTRNQNFESPYGDGYFAQKALDAIKQGLNVGKHQLLLKKFVDINF